MAKCNSPTTVISHNIRIYQTQINRKFLSYSRKLARRQWTAAVRRRKRWSFKDTKAKSTTISRKRVSIARRNLRPERMPFQDNDCCKDRVQSELAWRHLCVPIDLNLNYAGMEI